MGRKLKRKNARLQHELEGFKHSNNRYRDNLREAQRVAAKNDERMAELRRMLENLQNGHRAELARYQFIDRLLDEAFKYCEHYPLRAYIQGERQALSYPQELLHMDHIQQMVALRGTFSGESPAKEAINTLQYYVMEIVNRNYGSPLYGVKPMICAHYRGQAVSYVQPESMKLLTKSQQYDIVMRELTPAVLAMIDKANC